MSAPQALVAGRYRLMRVIATGGMGVVWEAWDERLDRPVAIKQLRTHPGVPDREARLAKSRAIREARITAQLEHPHAVPVFDAVEHEDQPWLIMPFLPSSPLSAVLRERRALPLLDVVRIGSQTASALAAAHKLRIIHRDVKPGNILITADGAAHISDFGISQAMGDTTLTATGLVHGTPAYLAPEVARGDEATFASDVFSLGSTVYAAIEGAPPFGVGPNPMALLHKVAAGVVPPPAHAGQLTPLLLDMLSARPEARPTMDEVATSLIRLRSGMAAAEPTWPMLAPLVDPQPAPSAAATDDGPARGQEPAASGQDDGASAPSVTERETAAESGESPPEAAPTRRRAVAVGTGGAVLAAALLTTALMTGQLGPDAPDTAADPGQALPSSAAQSAGTTPTASSTSGAPTPDAPSSPTTAPAAAAPAAAAEPEEEPEQQTQPEVTTEPEEEPEQETQPQVTTEPEEEPEQETQPQVTTEPEAEPEEEPEQETQPEVTTEPEAEPEPETGPEPEASEESTSQDRATQLTSALTGYYALMPDDTDAAWPRMTADYQTGHARGREAYERFWDDIAEVAVSDLQPAPPDGAEATLTYYFEDGRTVVERTSYRFVEDGGTLKIASSTVLSSSDG